jgi:hypothetical protein
MSLSTYVGRRREAPRIDYPWMGRRKSPSAILDSYFSLLIGCVPRRDP